MYDKLTDTSFSLFAVYGFYNHLWMYELLVSNSNNSIYFLILHKSDCALRSFAMN